MKPALRRNACSHTPEANRSGGSDTIEQPRDNRIVSSFRCSGISPDPHFKYQLLRLFAALLFVALPLAAFLGAVFVFFVPSRLRRNCSNKSLTGSSAAAFLGSGNFLPAAFARINCIGLAYRIFKSVILNAFIFRIELAIASSFCTVQL